MRDDPKLLTRQRTKRVLTKVYQEGHKTGSNVNADAADERRFTQITAIRGNQRSSAASAIAKDLRLGAAATRDADGLDAQAGTHLGR